MSDSKKPDDKSPRADVDKAFATLEKGLGDLFKAAEVVAGSVAGSVKKELDKSKVGRTLDDAGRELARAASNVASFVGQELTEWSKKAQPAHPQPGGPQPGPYPGPAPSAAGAPPHPDASGWPTTREEYERRYGPSGDEWPRSAEEYERWYGKKPKPTGPTDDDPGFHAQ